jgi:hypothetical protein
MQTIEVTIKPDGTTEIHVQGVKGMACTDITAALEKALGGKPERELTDEAHESDLTINDQLGLTQ